MPTAQPSKYRFTPTRRASSDRLARGSDFHSPGESRVDLGALPALPTDLTPVWQALAQRIVGPTRRCPRRAGRCIRRTQRTQRTSAPGGNDPASPAALT